MVVQERFAMLANIQLGIVRVYNVNEQLPNGGMCPTMLLRRRSNVLFFNVMVVVVVEPINNGPWGAIAMLATRIIVVQEFGVIGDELVAQGIRHWCYTTARKQLVSNKAPPLQMLDCDSTTTAKAKLNAKP